MSPQCSFTFAGNKFQRSKYRSSCYQVCWVGTYWWNVLGSVRIQSLAKKKKVNVIMTWATPLTGTKPLGWGLRGFSGYICIYKCKLLQMLSTLATKVIVPHASSLQASSHKQEESSSWVEEEEEVVPSVVREAEEGLLDKASPKECNYALCTW